MKRIRLVVMSMLCAALLMMLVRQRVAASDRPNFSGNYIVEHQKKSVGNENESILEIVQNDDSIEITRVERGKKTISRCPLNGSDGDYTSPSGVSGKCKAQLKPKYLILEFLVVTHPQQASSPVRVHTKEKWQLSADAKMLTIKSDVDFPDSPSDVSAVVGEAASGTEKYTRTSP